MNKRFLLAILLQGACTEVPVMEKAPVFEQGPEAGSKDTTTHVAAPAIETGNSTLPMFERIDEDTILAQSKAGPLVHEGKTLSSKSVLALERDTVVSSEKQTFVVKNGSPLKLPSLDVKKVGKGIAIDIEVDANLSFALVAGDGEEEGSCLSLRAKELIFLERSDELAQSCWVSLNDWPATVPAIHNSKGLRFTLPVSSFEDLSASFLRIVAKEIPVEEQTAASEDPLAKGPAKVDSNAGIQVVQISQDPVETLPVLIPDLYDTADASPSAENAASAQESGVSSQGNESVSESPAADEGQPPSETEATSSAPTSEESLPADPETIANTDTIDPAEESSSTPVPASEESPTVSASEETPSPAASEETLSVTADESSAADALLGESSDEDSVDEPSPSPASPETIAFVQEIFDNKSSRYAELKARFEALHKERNDERERRKKLRETMKVQKKTMRESCKKDKKGSACDEAKNLLEDLEKDDESMTQQIAALKAQINDVKKEAEAEALSLKEVKAKLNALKGVKLSRAARLAAKERRLAKKAVLAAMRDDREKEKEAKKAAEEQEKAARKAELEAEKAKREAEKESERLEKEKLKEERKEEKAAEKEEKSEEKAGDKEKSDSPKDKK